MRKVLIFVVLSVLLAFGISVYLRPAKPPFPNEKIEKEIAELTEQLKQNPTDRNIQLQLAIDYKNIGEYRRAEELLLSLTKEWPHDFVAFNNLGDLYQNYLKDYPKAEAAHKRVIALNPAFIQGYINLYDLYRLFYTEKKDQATEILKLGLAKDPNNTQLKVLLGRQ